MRVLLVDPQESFLRLMRSLLASVPDVQVVAEARTFAEARTRISELQPDLVVTDVMIPGGNGLQLLHGLETPPGVIFVAARQDFALPAFEIQAIDYLVKPMQRQRFLESIQRARKRIAENRIATLASRILSAAALMNDGTRMTAISPSLAYPDQITIRVRRRVFWLDVGDISWVQGANQYSRIHARTGEYLLTRSLASLECELDPKRFFRVHKSTIVNAAHVQEIRSGGEGRYNVQLRGGPMLPASRSRRDVLHRLMEGVGACSARAQHTTHGVVPAEGTMNQF